jgi:site-specific DNA-methyltransferase (adenine-specific)
LKGCGRKIGELDCCTVINGDCDEYLWQIPADVIDLVVTDPPYGMSFVSGARKEKYAAIVGDDRLPVETIEQLIRIPRLASYFFCRWDNLWDHESLPKPKSVLTWVKPGTGMGDLNHEHGRASEIALFYPGSAHKFKVRPSDIMDSRRTGNVVHPTQKPVELIRDMLKWYDFETVLDPYVGGGTTALAALELKKHFLAFEIDPAHYATASARIESARGRKSLTQEGLDLGR